MDGNTFSVLVSEGIDQDTKNAGNGFSRRLSENVLFTKLFVMPEKIILGISTICLW